MTPFQAFYGRPSPRIPHYHACYCPVNEVDKSLVSQDALLQQLKENLRVDNNQMKQQVDSKRKDIQFQVGDLVFLKLHPYQKKISLQKSILKTCEQILWTISD